MECLAVKTYRHLLNTSLSPVAAVEVLDLLLVAVARAVCLAELHQLHLELM
jgi:hypothetical protein